MTRLGTSSRSLDWRTTCSTRTTPHTRMKSSSARANSSQRGRGNARAIDHRQRFRYRRLNIDIFLAGTHGSKANARTFRYGRSKANELSGLLIEDNGSASTTKPCASNAWPLVRELMDCPTQFIGAPASWTFIYSDAVSVISSPITAARGGWGRENSNGGIVKVRHYTSLRAFAAASMWKHRSQISLPQLVVRLGVLEHIVGSGQGVRRVGLREEQKERLKWSNCCADAQARDCQVKHWQLVLGRRGNDELCRVMYVAVTYISRIARTMFFRPRPLKDDALFKIFSLACLVDGQRGKLRPAHTRRLHLDWHDWTDRRLRPCMHGIAKQRH
nr:hypothetical protein CFP56_11056 [Quercus suber]